MSADEFAVWFGRSQKKAGARANETTSRKPEKHRKWKCSWKRSSGWQCEYFTAAELYKCVRQNPNPSIASPSDRRASSFAGENPTLKTLPARPGPPRHSRRSGPDKTRLAQTLHHSPRLPRSRAKLAPSRRYHHARPRSKGSLCLHAASHRPPTTGKGCSRGYGR